MRGSRLIHLWGTLTHCCEKKKESVNQFAKIGNLCSESTVIKKFSIIAGVPTITVFVAAFDAKALIARNCWNPTWLAGTGLLTATGKPTEIATIEIFDTTHGLRFLYICVFLSVLQKTNTLHLYNMRGGMKTLKHNVRTTLQLSYHGCKYLTHTSKTPHVKRTQTIVTVRFTIRVTSLL